MNKTTVIEVDCPWAKSVFREETNIAVGVGVVKFRS